MTRALWLLLAAAALLAAGPAAHAATLPCQTITGIAGCVECIASPATCYLCDYKKVPVFSAGKLTQCMAASASCATTAGGAQCDRCAGRRCLRCKENFAFDASGKCVALTTALCKAYSLNTGCAACNGDGSCRACTTNLLVPVNAVWLDAGYPETTCSTKAAINVDAQDILGANAYIPTNCIEIDSDYQCAACKAGFGPKAGTAGITCVANTGTGANTKNAGGCKTGLPYMQYCKQCNADGSRCLKDECTASRSLDPSGYCSLNCKGLWGIGCLTCSKDACLTIDPIWANGR